MQVLIFVKHIFVRYAYFDKSIKKSETDVSGIIRIVTAIILKIVVPA